MPSVLNRARQPVFPPSPQPGGGQSWAGRPRLTLPRNGEKRGEAGRSWEAFAGLLLPVVSPVPQNRVRRRSILCPEPVFWGPSALPPAIGGSWTPRADPQPRHQAGPSLSHSAPIAFSLQFGVKKKKAQSSLEASPVPGPGVPCATPGAGPSLGTGSRGTGGGTHPGLTRSHQSAQRAVL